jgi:hypothetical protein
MYTKTEIKNEISRKSTVVSLLFLFKKNLNEKLPALRGDRSFRIILYFPILIASYSGKRTYTQL